MDAIELESKSVECVMGHHGLGSKSAECVMDSDGLGSKVTNVLWVSMVWDFRMPRVLADPIGRASNSYGVVGSQWPGLEHI